MSAEAKAPPRKLVASIIHAAREGSYGADYLVDETYRLFGHFPPLDTGPPAASAPPPPAPSLSSGPSDRDAKATPHDAPQRSTPGRA